MSLAKGPCSTPATQIVYAAQTRQPMASGRAETYDRAGQNQISGPFRETMGTYLGARVSQTAPHKHRDNGRGRFENLRLLLVEDVVDNQVLITRLLQPTGMQVEVAENGQIGVQKALNDDFHVILMDIQMPIMNGYQATQSLRDEGYSGPIVALTAHAMQGEREKCLQSGFNDFITKPLDRFQLIQTIEHWAQNKNPQ